MRGLPREKDGEKGAAMIAYEKPRLIDPMTCIFAGPTRVGAHLKCAMHDTWVECQTSHWGEPPMCAYDEPDNSDEARARRRAWREDE